MRLDLHLLQGIALVTLSRQNLLALLAKLDEQATLCMLSGRYAYVDFELSDDLTLIVRAQPDDQHYTGREPAGPMSPNTETGIRRIAESAPDRRGTHAPRPRSDDCDGRISRDPKHSADRLHPWVFLQHQVWVDIHGREHEIETMTADYVRNVVTFCRDQAPRIALLALLELLRR